MHLLMGAFCLGVTLYLILHLSALHHWRMLPELQYNVIKTLRSENAIIKLLNR